MGKSGKYPTTKRHASRTFTSCNTPCGQTGKYCSRTADNVTDLDWILVGVSDLCWICMCNKQRERISELLSESLFFRRHGKGFIIYEPWHQGFGSEGNIASSCWMMPLTPGLLSESLFSRRRWPEFIPCQSKGTELFLLICAVLSVAVLHLPFIIWLSFLIGCQRPKNIALFSLFARKTLDAEHMESFLIVRLVCLFPNKNVFTCTTCPEKTWNLCEWLCFDFGLGPVTDLQGRTRDPQDGISSSHRDECGGADTVMYQVVGHSRTNKCFGKSMGGSVCCSPSFWILADAGKFWGFSKLDIQLFFLPDRHCDQFWCFCCRP